jgi:folate-binding protein YgfZ
MSSLTDQLKAIQNGAALYEDPSGHLKIEGVGATGFLHKITSNDIIKQPSLMGLYDALLDRKGMVLSLFYLIRLNETSFSAITPPELTEKTTTLLTKMKFIEKVTIKNESAERKLIRVIGPKAEAILEKAGLKLENENKIVLLESSLVWKENLFSSPLITISAPITEAAKILELLAPTAVKLEETAVRLFEMESGYPQYGVDIDESHILLESPLPIAHQRNKGCYPGQEVIERISTYGKGRTPKTLCRLKLDGNHPLPSQTEIFASTGEKAGKVTSALYNPLQEKTVVLAYLDHKHVEGATALAREGDRFILVSPAA